MLPFSIVIMVACLCLSNALTSAMESEARLKQLIRHAGLKPRDAGIAPVYTAGIENGQLAKYIMVLKKEMNYLKFKDLIKKVRTIKLAKIEAKPLDFGDDIQFCEVVANDLALNALRMMDDVKYVEVVQKVKPAEVCECSKQRQTLNWGADRMDQRVIPLNGRVTTPECTDPGKSDVDVYVVDTGIYVLHSEFGGRALWGTNTADNVEEDIDGHGTHVAGIIGGNEYGIARCARIIAVKVFHGKGHGSTVTVARGLQWIINHRKLDLKRRAIVNLSLFGGWSTTLNQLVETLNNMGTLVVVAAGNDRYDACYYSPASETTAFTVAGSDPLDMFCEFSNYGQCVDIIAPGFKIKSASIGSMVSYETKSGTSLSVPHVVGAAASYMECNRTASPLDAKQWLIDKATLNVIRDVPPATPNRFLYYSCNEERQPFPARPANMIERVEQFIYKTIGLFKGY